MPVTCQSAASASAVSDEHSPKTLQERCAAAVDRMVVKLGLTGVAAAGISATNRILVAKGICTEDELREAFIAEEARP